MIEVVLDTRPAAARLDYRRASRSKAASAATEKRREIVSLNGEKEPLKQFGAISLRSFLAAPMADKGYAKLFAIYPSQFAPAIRNADRCEQQEKFGQLQSANVGSG